MTTQQEVTSKLKEWWDGPAARVIRTLVCAFVAAAASIVLLFIAGAALSALFSDETSPRARPLLPAQLVVLIEVALAILILVFWLRFFARRFQWPLQSSWLAVAGVAFLLVPFILTRPSFKPPAAPSDPANTLAELEAGRRSDVVLVIDPGSKSGRVVIEAAQNQLEKQTAPEGVRWDTAFGVVTVSRGQPQSSVVLQPTNNRRQVLTALAGIKPQAGPPPTGAYGRLLVATMTGSEVTWRRGADPAVVLYLDRLPSQSELDVAADQQRSSHEHGKPPVRWAKTLNAITPSYLIAPVPGTSADPSLFVVTQTNRKSQPGSFREWERWTRATAGNVEAERNLPNWPAPLDPAEALTVDHVSTSQLQLAFDFRPQLLFDSHEAYVPLDVDRFLAETKDGHPAHQMCNRKKWTVDDCEDLESSADLLRGKSLLNIADGARNGADLSSDQQPGVGPKQRIYYHLSEDRLREEVYVDYWLFYRFNVSPVASRLTCQPGFAIANATCFDHEGDWEGLTVILRHGAGDKLIPVGVNYAQHNDVVRYPWAYLVRVGSVTDTHPLAYVAFGSHASYPTSCRDSVPIFGDCTQVAEDVPDGRRNGKKVFPENDDAQCQATNCVLPLPTTITGAPALWAGFRGRWGAADCTAVAAFCVKSDGPLTPTTQNRYVHPGTAQNFAVHG